MTMLEPVPGCDLPVFLETMARYTLFYMPGCAVVAASGTTTGIIIGEPGSSLPHIFQARIESIAQTIP